MESDRDYLITGFYGENSIAGTPFIRRAQNAFQDKNTVIFGHNMRDGTMFAALKNYLKSEYCKQYPTITILNKGREYKYKLFSVRLLNEDDGAAYRAARHGQKYNNPINLLWKRQKACSTGIWGGIIYGPEQFG